MTSLANCTVPGVGQKHASLRNLCTSATQRDNSCVDPLYREDGRDPSDDYIYGPGPVPFEQVSMASGSATYLLTDQLGSVIIEADSSASITATQSYNPYGTLSSTLGSWTTPFGFAGGYRDTTGLIYLINRYYDPATGQFVSVDPLVGVTGAAYGYVGGDPSNFIDQIGLGVFGSCFMLTGQAAAECDVRYLFTTAFAPLDCVKCATFLNILLGGALTLFVGEAAIWGAFSGGALGVVEAFEFLTNSYVAKALHSVENVIYADLTTVSVICGIKVIFHPSEEDVTSNSSFQWFVKAVNLSIAWVDVASRISNLSPAYWLLVLTT